ncbi:phage tail sheath family protein [Streptomyces justiciae]|uniref:Phage tail sheath subtilisin-like domain-containing protein n=1 Tax=Streptomyces justiciae TaxID=2780140 RepID=A0ABU3M099_9ACTN|nr:phage tail sheath subtilisin-like domain-containing protein [Streptomyces justiciae]MDT7844935.1 phage tail sheath subtilisin-like domain-containing protein [Streptomyces justiciae]
MSYQSPGVYIEEVPSGPQPIAAASTSVVAAIGSLCKGPVGVPTRVTGWADFVRTFGTAHARGFTPEALYGFFENGGTAAWVVRADPSVAATWKIYDSATTATLSFEATATSPGAWANGVTLGVSPDLTGGAGAMAQAVVSGPVSVPSGTGSIPVYSSGGFLAGDTVTLMKGTGTSVNATVNTVAANSLNVTADASIGLAEGDVVAARTAAAPTTILLASGSGLKPGDLLAIQSADGSRVTGVIAAVVKQGPRTAVTLGAPLGSAVVGAGLARRIARFRGTIAGGAATFTLGQITWEVDPALAPVNSESQMAHARATVSSGAVAAFGGAHFAMPGGQNAPAGTVLVDAQVRVAVYTEAIDLAADTVADVLARFDFLPVGTAIRLTDGTNTTTVTRTGEATAATSGAPLPQIFTSASFLLPANASKGVVVRCAVPPRVGEFVDFDATTRLRITGVTKANGTVYVLTFAETTDLSAIATSRFPLVAFSPTTFFPVRFNLTVTDGGALAESHTGLALDPSHPRYFARDGVVNGVSAYVTVAPRAAGAAAIGETTTPAYALSAQAGVDVAPANADFKKALTKLEEQQEPSQVICPDSVTLEDPLLQADLVGAVVDHCEAFRRFAVVDAPDFDETALVTWRNQTVASTYAAVYAPHLKMVAIDPDATERFRTVPPSGFVAGVFARTDRERGVAKAPANEQVGGIVGLSRTFTPRHQDLLNPAAVNLLRAFPGRGIRIWGARTTTDDAAWRYVNVRRLFNFVERSVENATQWVVFEPNTASTWIRIKVSLEGFLDQLWRAGALAGGKPEEAYRVSVGLGETMTAADINLGLVITEVALAPAKPAEFVIFRFSHKRQSE